ncbi:hypothetical protein A2U01_0093834, partial [Trifolium medium]|nr:hypothetical protein [Trifolium medium]
MITEERIMVVVKGSKAMVCAISVGRGVICRMIARRKAISVLVADDACRVKVFCFNCGEEGHKSPA